MRSSHCRIAPPVAVAAGAAVAAGVLALAPGAPPASLLRRSSSPSIALGTRRPPLARRLRAVSPEDYDRFLAAKEDGRSTQEALVSITAHEAMHLRQWTKGRKAARRNGGRFNEVETEWAAFRLWRRWKEGK